MTVPATPEGAEDQARRAAVRLLESVYELTGGSMSPTLERGWKVLVEPLDRPLESGDVILLDCPSGRVIHRYLGAVTWGSPPRKHVIHAGDSSVLPGIAPASRVSGRVSAVVWPAGHRHEVSSRAPPGRPAASLAVRRPLGALRAAAPAGGRRPGPEPPSGKRGAAIDPASTPDGLNPSRSDWRRAPAPRSGRSVQERPDLVPWRALRCPGESVRGH
jgi:hypothetical protein